MNRADVSVDGLADLLRTVRGKGVRLWPENGRLRYCAPRNVLTSEELTELRHRSAQIVALLERASRMEVAETIRVSPRPHERAPVTFSQLSHWNTFRLAERPSLKQIASALRLRGRLDVDALRGAIAALVRHQDALRTRVILVDGTPVQEIVATIENRLEIFDLVFLPAAAQDSEIKRLIDELILEDVDVQADSLFGLRLLRLSDEDHILVVAMEHMISDMFSVGLLWRELFTAYSQIIQGMSVCLTPVPVQFSDFAEWRRRSHSAWMMKHGAYWDELVMHYERPMFPGDLRLAPSAHPGWGAISLNIGKELTARLRAWSRARKTTVPMTVFAAYVATILRWCDIRESIIRYQSDGRASAELQGTIGFFASALFVRASLRQDDTFDALMSRMTEAYCAARERADFSRLAAHVPRPDVTRAPLFNWIPQHAAVGPESHGQGVPGLTSSGVRFEHPLLKRLQLDIDPSAVLFDTDDEVLGDIQFPLCRFSENTMQGFARVLRLVLRAMLEQPLRRVCDVSISC